MPGFWPCVRGQVLPGRGQFICDTPAVSAERKQLEILVHCPQTNAGRGKRANMFL
jgi:hypothetical protein